MFFLDKLKINNFLKDAKINYYPVTRDCLFYGLSVAALLIVLYDGEILWYESIVLILLYLVYIVIMYFNNDIELMLKKKGINPLVKKH